MCATVYSSHLFLPPTDGDERGEKHSSEIFMHVVFCDSAFRGLEHSPVLQGLDLIILNYTHLAKFMAVRR